MKTSFKPLIAALALAALSSASHAASFERVDSLASGGYSASTNGTPLSEAATDLSGATGDVALFGANTFDTAVGSGGLSQSYSADAFLTFGATSTDLFMSNSQSVSASGASAWSLAGHSQDSFMDLSAVTLRIAGDAGEANGSAVNVSFAGMAESLFASTSMNSGFMGLSVSRGATVLGEYSWDMLQAGSQNVAFSFAAAVGEELTFSSYMLSTLTLAPTSFAASAQAQTLAEAGASLNGSFAIAAVPEPESLAMLLAGLGFMGFVARRRKAG